jgi:hypothetical protein
MVLEPFIPSVVDRNDQKVTKRMRLVLAQGIKGNALNLYAYHPLG